MERCRHHHLYKEGNHYDQGHLTEEQPDAPHAPLFDHKRCQIQLNIVGISLHRLYNGFVRRGLALLNGDDHPCG